MNDVTAIIIYENKAVAERLEIYVEFIPVMLHLE